MRILLTISLARPLILYLLKYVPSSRFLTLLVYLNDADDSATQEGGTPAKSASDDSERRPSAGGTSFPKAYAGRGLEARPPKGDAVLFYSLLPDGNGDETSEHAGMPVPPGQDEKVS